MAKPGDKILLIPELGNRPDQDLMITTRTWDRQAKNDPIEHEHFYGFCTEGGNYAHHVSGRLFIERARWHPFKSQPELRSVDDIRKILKTILTNAQEALACLPEEGVE